MNKNDWNKLKEWIWNELTNINKNIFDSYSYRWIVLGEVYKKMDEIENENIQQSLTENGY